MGDNVRVGIVSQFDPSGAEAASASLGKLSAEARASSAAVSSNSLAASSAGKAMRGGASGAAAMAAALGAGQTGVAATARGASAALAGFAAGGLWGLLIAGVAAGAAAWMRYRARVREALEESTAAFKRHTTAILQARLDRTVEAYKRQADAIRDAARASEQLNAAASRADAAQAKQTALLLKGEMLTKLSTETDPAARKRVELDYAKQIADVELNAAKTAAQYAENAAARKLAAARSMQSAAAGESSSLAKELGQTQEGLKPAVLKKLEDSRNREAAAAADVLAAENDLAAATIALASSRTAIQIAEAEHADRLAALARDAAARVAASQELASTESELESVSADLAAAMREEAASRAHAARAQDRAERAGGGTLKNFVDAQREKYRTMEDERKEDEKFKRRVADLKERRDTGRRLSKKDQLDLDFAEQRGRAVEAAAARARRETENADMQRRSVTFLEKSVTELQQIRANLAKSLEVS